MTIEKTKYEKSDAIAVVVNMATKAYQTRASAIRAVSPKSTREQVYEKIVADVYEELKAKADAKADRDFIFNKKVQAGTYVKAPDALIDAIKADHAKVRYARSEGDTLTMYAHPTVYKLARAWKYSSFEHGTCMARPETIADMLIVYGIEA